MRGSEHRARRPPALRAGLRLALRGGGGLQMFDPTAPVCVEVEEMTDIEQMRNGLDPTEFPPQEPQYNERGEMVFPPPMNLEPIADFNRLIDDNGRLMTSKEAQKLGMSKFARKKKGKNSLARRCTCGNKLPCDGDVVITKNEHGKLEYHKVPRHWIGPAHAFECRQPAQYTVTPSGANVTQLFAHLSPLLLEQVADWYGMDSDAAQKLGDVAARNATLDPATFPCVTCNSTRHLYIDCPWTTVLTPRQVSQLQEQLRELKARNHTLSLAAAAEAGGAAAEAGGEAERAKKMADTRRAIEDLSTLLWANEEYPEVDLDFGNRTFRYNEDGTNEALGQVTLRDWEKVHDGVPEAPAGAVARVPEDFADMEKATRGARDGQTIVVRAGLTAWYEQAWVECLDSSYAAGSPAAAAGANLTHIRICARIRVYDGEVAYMPVPTSRRYAAFPAYTHLCTYTRI